MTDLVDLVCKECGANYQKPKQYVDYAALDDQWTLNSFYQRQITLCNPCRQTKERSMLERGLKNVIESLSKQANSVSQ